MSSSSHKDILPEDVQRLLCHFLDWATLQRWSLCRRDIEALVFSSRHLFNCQSASWDRNRDIPWNSILRRLPNVRTLNLSAVDFGAISDSVLNRFGDTVTKLDFSPAQMCGSVSRRTMTVGQVIDRMPRFNRLKNLFISSCNPSEMKRFISEHIPASNGVETLRIMPSFPYTEEPYTEQNRKNYESLCDLAEFCAFYFSKVNKICWNIDWTEYGGSGPTADYLAKSIAPFSKCSRLKRISVDGSALGTLLWHVVNEPPSSEVESLSRVKTAEKSIWKAPGQLWQADTPIIFFAVLRSLESPGMWEYFLTLHSLESFTSSPRLLKALLGRGVGLDSLRVLLSHGLDLATPIAPSREDRRTEFLLHYLIETFIEDAQYFELIFFAPIVRSSGLMLTPFEHSRRLHPGLLFSNRDTLFAKVLSVETESTLCLEYLISKGLAIAALAPDDPKFVGSFNEPDPWGTLPMDRCGWIRGSVVSFALRNGAEATPDVFLRSCFDANALRACLEKNPNLLLQVQSYNGVSVFTHVINDDVGTTEPAAETISGQQQGRQGSSSTSVLLDWVLSPAHPELASVATSESALQAVERFVSFFVNCNMDYPPEKCPEEVLADVIRRLILLLESCGRLKFACGPPQDSTFGSSYWHPRWSPPNDPLLLVTDTICQAELEILRRNGVGRKIHLLSFTNLVPVDFEGLAEAKEEYVWSRVHKVDIASKSTLFQEVVQEWKKASLTPLHLLVNAGKFFSKTSNGCVPETILRVIRAIVDAGFPPTDTDSNGKTPLQLADFTCIAQFESAGLH